MTAFEQLNAYLKHLEWRLRLFAASRGAAIVAALALALTVLLVWISNRFAFAQNVVLPLRITLFVVLAIAVSLTLAWPLLKLNRRRVTNLVEKRAPEFQERLLTLTERQKAGDPWSELLAEDALRIASVHRPEEISSSRSLFGTLGSGLLAAIILLWLISAGPGYWGYGASLLWTGKAAASKRPIYDITVQPGDKTIRRRSDQLVTAQLFGFSANHVTLHVRYGNAPKWDETSMQPKASGDGYRFLFAGLSDAVEYYVQADKAQSRHFTIHVKDLPNVKRVRVALKYPTGLGLQNVVLDPGGDIRAVNGTQAEVSVLTDRPLEQGALMLDGGKRIDLKAGEGNWLSARLPVEKDGAYHIAAIDNGEAVRISDDYFIEAKKDEPPTVKLLKPGRDPHVSPIEEVPVTVDAADDFGVQGMELHYSVNGGPEKTIPLLKSKGAKEAQGTATIAFEDLKVVPGDVVSMYATARDATTKAQSEIIFAQAEPFDFKFSQSQQMGGGGGGGMGNQSSDISQRQKQVIAATFNELKDKGKNRAALAEDAKLLSDLQGKLSEQAMTLAQRMASRELGSAGSEFAQFSKLMTDAAGDMAVAVEQLKSGKWNDALPPEQKALGSLMRAEALFRNIQVAFNQQNGGGGGGNSGAQRDLARMFDLELDTSKNQYETGQQASAQQQQQDTQKALDEAYQRLQALARRQEELAAQNSQQQQQFEQRWEEEQLRREAEELRKQMQQLAQNSQNQSQSGSQSQQGQQQGQQKSSSQGSSSSSSSSGQSGQQTAQSASGSSSGSSAQRSAQERQMAETMKRADNALQRAEDEMRKAVSDRDASARQRAAAQLREAQGLLNRMMSGQAGNSMAEMASRAEQMANAQKELAGRMKEMYGEGSSRSRQRYFPSGQAGSEQMPEMRDPNSTRFGYGFQRRYGMDEMRPSRAATPEEKAVANEKERLASELQHLQEQMQQQAQSMAGSRPDASAKLSRALSEAESKELALRMQKGADWMRQGYGDRNVGMEDAVTAGLQQLSRDLRDAQGAMNKPGSQVPGAGNDKTAQALAEVRQLREELDRRAAETLQRGGQEGAQGQPSESNGSPSGQPGRGQQEARNGSYSPRGGASPSGLDREGVQSAIGQLRGLRAQVDPHDRALAGYIDGALGTLQHLTGAQAGLLDARLNRDTFLSLQRLEVELNRRVTQQEAGGTRTGAREESPEKYREAVAGYFKKLSQGKQAQGQ